jgi:hypothetical protein
MVDINFFILKVWTNGVQSAKGNNYLKKMTVLYHLSQYLYPRKPLIQKNDYRHGN